MNQRVEIGEGMSGQSILVVEDERSISEVISLYLARAGYTVTVVHDGLEALKRLALEKPNLVILDIMLPGVDGLEITRRLRAEGETPIIMLTARGGETDRIIGLEMGADDYVVKPFSPQELVSRVRAVLRRTLPAASSAAGGVSPRAIRFPDLLIDPATRLVTRGSDEITLTAKEFDLLYLLASHPRQVFNRDQLLDRVWGETEYIDPSTVTVHVRRLREKIEVDPSAPHHIHTVWGVGYKFEP